MTIPFWQFGRGQNQDVEMSENANDDATGAATQRWAPRVRDALRADATRPSSEAARKTRFMVDGWGIPMCCVGKLHVAA